MCLGEIIYQKAVIKRYDEVSYIKCFTYLDFPGLLKDDFSFQNHEFETINGSFYYYPNFNEDCLIIFCHGIGGGHLHYMQEINMLASAGYLVLAYDNTGCASSSGSNIRGMTQSLADLDCCINHLKKDPKFKTITIDVVGHSWGGYAAGNIANFQDVNKVVVISGFTSIDVLLKQFLKGILGIFKKSIFNYEQLINPKYVHSSSIDAFNKHNVKALVIHSNDDEMVRIESGLAKLKKEVTNPNVKYLETTNKKHNPNYTLRAITYMNETFDSLNKAIKKKQVKTTKDKEIFMQNVNWQLMTEQDENIWHEIYQFLKNE